MKLRFRGVLVAVACLMIFALASCGGSGSLLSSVYVEISPESVTLRRGETQIFRGTETVTFPTSTEISQASDRFFWSIEEGDDGGTLERRVGSTVEYVYTAPDYPGEYHIRVESRQEPGEVARATIRVR